MPTPRLDPEKVFDVADQLPCHHNEVDEAVWLGCADARHRSTLSRAYYAVFLALKKRLVDSKLLRYPFPEDRAHDKLYRAVKDALKPYHVLTQKIQKLRTDRRTADYELDMEIDRELAESRLDDAHEALEKIDGLKDFELARIAKLLDG